VRAAGAERRTTPALQDTVGTPELPAYGVSATGVSGRPSSNQLVRLATTSCPMARRVWTRVSDPGVPSRARVYPQSHAGLESVLVAKTYTASDGKLVLTLTPAEEGGFVVTSPLEPELVTQAESLDEAFEMARDAVRSLRASRTKLMRKIAASSRRSA
jgi:hypothetical protein